MKINLGTTDFTPSREQISAAESALGAEFSTEYLSFLTIHDGAVPDANVFRISEDNSAGVTAFIPVGKLAYEHGLIDKEIAKSFFPFAYAEGGNYVCMPLSTGAGHGVFFLDHEIPGLHSLTKVSDSLVDFLSDLRPTDPEAVELRPGQVKSAWIDPRFLE
ncbi:MAG TPA: SMI1/KNR4 family protein [Steroidobacteraceae bacterium]|jgi:hypothetical protein